MSCTLCRRGASANSEGGAFEAGSDTEPGFAFANLFWASGLELKQETTLHRSLVLGIQTNVRLTKRPLLVRTGVANITHTSEPDRQ
jgi:hypothetical protein